MAAEKIESQRRKLVRDWAKAPSWTLREAIILSFDGSPIEPDQEFEQGLPFDQAEVNRRVEFAKRALRRRELPQDPTPAQFVTWAAKAGFPFPEIWLDAIPELREQRSADTVSADPVPDPVADASDILRTRERESLLKLIIGMAVAGYRYDPNAPRSPTTAEIAGDLERLGVGLDPDTIRKWLRQASELLPRKPISSDD